MRWLRKAARSGALLKVQIRSSGIFNLGKMILFKASAIWLLMWVEFLFLLEAVRIMQR